ncbi:hypothetical protein MIR68_009158 [Amoeboaphelidium protococcarum]|nr:hypothetical protein MIR68_009158 [Amoeboaphelidium protococcarum]
MMDVALCYDVALETTVENKVSTIFDEYCHVDHAEEANFDDGGYEQNEDVPECITAITVRHRQNQQVNVGVSVFENSSDLCSCRYETNKGSVCRHFLAAFLELQMLCCLAQIFSLNG